jgi:hypothetical protein
VNIVRIDSPEHFLILKEDDAHLYSDVTGKGIL